MRQEGRGQGRDWGLSVLCIAAGAEVMANARVAEACSTDDEAEDQGGIFRRVVAAGDLGVQAKARSEQKHGEGEKGADLFQVDPPGSLLNSVWGSAPALRTCLGGVF
jgi:hypothetical protein